MIPRSSVCRKGDYDAAPVASDVYERMARRGQIKESDFRVIYRSKKFPTSSFAYAHDLGAEAGRQGTVLLLRLPLHARDAKAFDGADRFFPINHKTTWAPVREVAAAGGELRQGRLCERNRARSGGGSSKEIGEAR